MVLDALNLETSQIVTMNEDLARSLNVSRLFSKVTLNNEDVPVGKDYWNMLHDDSSNFLIGFSLSQVGFQSGTVSSPNTNVPFIFDAVLDRTKDTGRENTDPIKTSIIVMFLVDCALMIQVVPDSDIPIVKLSSKSIV
jgi:hypothetical protein